MGIFAEQAWAIFSRINRKTNGLTAYYSNESSWHIVVTRHNDALDGIPVEIKTRTGKNTWSVSTPSERIWSPDKTDFPFYAVYIVPWSSYDDGDGTHGMIRMIDNKKDRLMTRTRRVGMDATRIHRFLSEFQYPFLRDIRSMGDVFLFLHKKKFRKLDLGRRIVEGACHPDRINYYISLGHPIDSVCDY